jgi:hypothetical protein
MRYSSVEKRASRKKIAVQKVADQGCYMDAKTFDERYRKKAPGKPARMAEQADASHLKREAK